MQNKKEERSFGYNKRKFPNINTAILRSLLLWMNMSVLWLRGESCPLFDSNGALNDKLPKKIIENFGPTAKEILETHNS